MENAADALKMAGAVLIFVLALSIILLAFGQVREASDTILDYKDRETQYIDSSYYYEEVGTERNVNLETIIPSIFRAYLENYKIVFEGLSSPIYKIKNKDGNLVNKYTLDLETNFDKTYNNVVLGTNEKKAEFIRGILYKDFSNNENLFEKEYHIKLTGCESIYKQLIDAVNGGRTITEHLGVCYQTDDEDVHDVMKTEKRIITYKIGN